MQLEQLKKEIALIAREECLVDTLETRNMDALDFHSISVWSLETALIRAYWLGKNRTK